VFGWRVFAGWEAASGGIGFMYILSLARLGLSRLGGGGTRSWCVSGMILAFCI